MTGVFIGTRSINPHPLPKPQIWIQLTNHLAVLPSRRTHPRHSQCLLWPPSDWHVAPGPQPLYPPDVHGMFTAEAWALTRMQSRQRTVSHCEEALTLNFAECELRADLRFWFPRLSPIKNCSNMLCYAAVKTKISKTERNTNIAEGK